MAPLSYASLSQGAACKSAAYGHGNPVFAPRVGMVGCSSRNAIPCAAAFQLASKFRLHAADIWYGS